MVEVNAKKCPRCGSTTAIITSKSINCPKCYYVWYKEANITTRNWDIKFDDEQEETDIE